MSLSILTHAQVLNEANPWPSPSPLTRSAVPVMDLSKCIPPKLAPFREFLEASAEAMQVPLDTLPPLALALASIGTARALEVELSPIWRETGPLWFAVLAEPGERKSAALSLLTGPLHAWQDNEGAYLKYALAAYSERRRITEARLTGLRQKISRATGTDLGPLEREALALTATLENTPVLETPSLVTSNATPESIRDLLTRNGEKVALVSSETDAGQLMGNRYSKTGGANIDLYLSAFTGESVPTHRVGRDMPLARPALSMALCVQPQALADVLSDPVAKGRGFIDRLCLVKPKSRMGTRITTPDPVSTHLIAWWGDTLRRLLDLKWPGRVILTKDGPARWEQGPRVLRLEPDAETALSALREHYESRIGEEGDLRPVSGFVSKLPGVIARIALALEAMQDPAAEFITGETMRAACEWAPFLLEHYRNVLGEAAQKPETKLAIRLLAAIKRKELTELTGREAQRLLDTSTPITADEVGKALEVLVDGDWLRDLTPPTEYNPKGGRPKSTRYAVNPAAYN